MMYVVCILIGIAIGMFIYFILTALYVSEHYFGKLKKADSEDGSYLFLDLDVPPEKMDGKKFVVFQVDFKNSPHE